MVLTELIFNSLEGKLGGCGGLDLDQELIFNSFNFGRVWWS